MRLEGKVALIAGAGSIIEIPGLPGIGRATAILFAQEGAKVVAADIRPRAGEKTVNMMRARKFFSLINKKREVEKGLSKR